MANEDTWADNYQLLILLKPFSNSGRLIVDTNKTTTVRVKSLNTHSKCTPKF